MSLQCSLVSLGALFFLRKIMHFASLETGRTTEQPETPSCATEKKIRSATTAGVFHMISLTQIIEIRLKIGKISLLIPRGAPNSFRGGSVNGGEKYYSYQKEITQNGLNVCDLVKITQFRDTVIRGNFIVFSTFPEPETNRCLFFFFRAFFYALLYSDTFKINKVNFGRRPTVSDFENP